MNNIDLREDAALLHYGKLGMKWGKRTGGTTASSKAQKKSDKEALKRAKILKSPGKLNRNRSKFTREEIDEAMKDMKLERELRSLSKDKISAGSQYANTILSYGTTAVAAYGFYKSPVGQLTVSAVKKAVGN